jgi:hypothetical protein
MIGLSNYIGDLAPTPVVTEVYPAASAFVRLNMSSSFSWTNSLLVTRVTGDDKNFSFNASRGISFRTDIIESSSVFEFNFLKYGTGVLDNRMTSYIFMGLGLISYYPRTYINNEWVSMRGFKSEGVKYGEYSMIVPFGIGYKYQLNRTVTFECQFGFRKTFTDYLDDVSDKYADASDLLSRYGKVGVLVSDPTAYSTENSLISNKVGTRRGNPDFKDWYMVAGVSLTYRIYARVKCARFY